MEHNETHLIETEIESKPIYEGRVVNLQLQTVRLPNGETSQREVIKHSGAVAVVPLLSDRRVLMIRQFRKPLDTVIWEIPAGTLEPDEELETAAARELQEEISYKPRRLIKLGSIFVAPGYSSEEIHLYLADDLAEASIDGDDDEFIDIHSIAFDEVIAMVYRGEIQDAKTIAALLLAQQYMASQT